jgi:crotonobetainyl-CoA:carnitine CoA-transferase CaiB-like acyl-CoA transferase
VADTDILCGIKVVEVASWVFVPAAGSLLADWGADVVKVEHPERGDPQRGLSSTTAGAAPYNPLMEQANRGKRSVGLDLTTDAGREVFYRLIAEADVFLTNALTAVRRKLRIDVDDLRAVNPRLIYARGTGHGIHGPEAERGAFDGAAYWSRGGIAAAVTPEGSEYPVWQRAGFGDSGSGASLAGGVVAALYRRERTGAPSVVDVSLLGTALWQLFPDVVAAPANRDRYGADGRVPHLPPRDAFPNPLTNYYRTKDGRFLFLTMMESDRFWPDLCAHLGRTDLRDDPRFTDHATRTEHARELIRELDEVFGARTLAEWKETLRTLRGVWSPVQTALETHTDEQVVANGYLQPVTTAGGHEISLVHGPVQFDGAPFPLRPAPGFAEDTDAVLLELGHTEEELVALKISGTVF